ncbi:alpha/beta fold hydrolase [Streptomyces sp. NPDC013457]|uniref:alpha/beta fold hydrolase n=1 Tax=Streptomyces sp. NPDC013457 TaxID=3364866 RepID=UPI003701BBE8
MPAYFAASDGTRLAHRTEHRTEDRKGIRGEGRAEGLTEPAGDPVICLPGGPTDSRYLGDLGGLSAYRRLVLPDPRGTGDSAVPEDPASYRCDRVAGDVEALRVHLGLDRIDLLGHSGGANTAVTYAARYPHRVRSLALITPGTAAVGIEVRGETRRTAALLRKGEPWFPGAFAALEALTEGRGADWDAIAPFCWGRWDEAARRHHAGARPGNAEAVAGFAAEGAFDPESTRAALVALEAPVLVLAGEFDLNSPPGPVSELAALFPGASFAVQSGAGHYPWIDDPDAFTATVGAFFSAHSPR